MAKLRGLNNVDEEDGANEEEAGEGAEIAEEEQEVVWWMGAAYSLSHDFAPAPTSNRFRALEPDDEGE
eukprot:8517326-Lingulodinium_polyedra.AAC.1